MCLAYISYRQYSDYPLIILSNRDEYYKRPTAKLDVWRQSSKLGLAALAYTKSDPKQSHDKPHNDYGNMPAEEAVVLGGIDLEHQGTWFAVSSNQRWGLLTNYRNPKKEKADARSRGNIIPSYLHSKLSAQDFIENLRKKKDTWNGFNLLLGEYSNQSNSRLHYYSNIADKAIELKQGLYGLSNHLLDTPWPKLSIGKAELASLLQERLGTAAPKQVNLADLEIELFKLMRNSTVYPDALLPSTGIELEHERLLSPRFISINSEYGTRSSSLLFTTKTQSLLIEQSYTPEGKADEAPLYKSLHYVQ